MCFWFVEASADLQERHWEETLVYRDPGLEGKEDVAQPGSSLQTLTLNRPFVQPQLRRTVIGRRYEVCRHFAAFKGETWLDYVANTFISPQKKNNNSKLGTNKINGITTLKAFHMSNLSQTIQKCLKTHFPAYLTEISKLSLCLGKIKFHGILFFPLYVKLTGFLQGFICVWRCLFWWIADYSLTDWCMKIVVTLNRKYEPGQTRVLKWILSFFFPTSVTHFPHIILDLQCEASHQRTTRCWCHRASAWPPRERGHPRFPVTRQQRPLDRRSLIWTWGDCSATSSIFGSEEVTDVLSCRRTRVGLQIDLGEIKIDWLKLIFGEIIALRTTSERNAGKSNTEGRMKWACGCCISLIHKCFVLSPLQPADMDTRL